MRVAPALIVVAAATLATPASAQDIDTVVHGATLAGSFTTAPVGDAILGELGGRWGGLRVIDEKRWVLEWETLIAIEAGWLGSEHPFLFLVGPHASAWVEAGHRFRSERAFSPYLGVRLAGDARSLASPGQSQEALNAVDGVGGNVARGALRVAAGSSYADDMRALLITMFVQEELDAPELHTPGLAFTELGIAGRYDASRSLTLGLEGRCGLTPDRHDALLGTSDSTMRCGVDASFRKIFGNGMWLGVTLSFQRDTDHISYANGASYETGSAPFFVGALDFGVPLWRSR